MEAAVKEELEEDTVATATRCLGGSSSTRRAACRRRSSGDPLACESIGRAASRGNDYGYPINHDGTSTILKQGQHIVKTSTIAAINKYVPRCKNKAQAG